MKTNHSKNKLFSTFSIKKFFKILLFNFIILIVLLFSIEYILFCKYKKEFQGNPMCIPKYIYHFKKPYLIAYKDPCGCTCREPVGLEYKSEPITVFGCSYAYGEFLQSNQIFSYKLSHLLKRPVYNRALPGTSIQHMYLQVCGKGERANSFYKEVHPSDTTIYLLMPDHYSRTLSYVFFNMFDNIFQPIYKLKDGKLVYQDNTKIPLVFIKSLYLSKCLTNFYTKKYLEDTKNAEKISDLFLTFFIQTRKTLEEKWNKKINFIVFLYRCDLEDKKTNLLKEKLENNGFIVISSNDLTTEQLWEEKYLMKENGHPKEEAWNLLTPLFVEKLKAMNIL